MMASYYQPLYIGDDIYHIYEPGGTYTSLIMGTKKAMLIDTGYGYGNLRKAVRSLTALPLVVVNTHGHFDHTGGNYQFENIYMHPCEYDIYRQYMRTVRPVTTGRFAKQDREIGTHVLPDDFDPDKFMASDWRFAYPLENGQIFDLGGRYVKTFILPGHTMHHAVFFDSQSRILFGGDDVSNNAWLQFDFSAPLHEYALHLQHLKEMLDADASGVPPVSAPVTQFASVFVTPPAGASASQFAGASVSPTVRILTSHSGVLFPEALFDCILTAIAHIDDEQSRIFVHPRTGVKSLIHTERFEGIPEIRKVHIVYDKNRK